MRKAFVLLELLNHMALVAEEARSRGFDLVVLNHDPVRHTGPYSVPAEAIAEQVHVESWADEAAVRQVIADVHSRYDVVGTYAAFEAVLPYEAELREMAGLPNSGAENVRRALDKAAVRRKLYDEGLSALRSTTLDEALGWDLWPYKGGAVLKPANGTGSALCFDVSSLAELHQAAERVREAAVVNPLMREYILAKGEFVLEERAEGELLSVESLVNRGEVHVVGCISRYMLVKDPVVEQGFTFPYRHPRLADIKAAAVAIHRSLGIHHGATHVEVMVPEEGPIELIDFNPRYAGVDAIVVFSRAWGVSFPSLLTDLACGVEPDLSFLRGPNRYASNSLVLPPPGTTELRELVFPPEVVFGRLMKEVGKPLSGRADQLDAVASFVIEADTALEIHHKLLDVRRRIVVNGEPLGDNENNVVTYSKYLADPERYAPAEGWA